MFFRSIKLDIAFKADNIVALAATYITFLCALTAVIVELTFLELGTRSASPHDERV